MDVSLAKRREPNRTYFLLGKVEEIALYMDKECRRIQMSPTVSHLINSIFTEQHGAWRRYSTMLTEFIIKVWPSTGMPSFDFIILEEIEQLVYDIETELVLAEKRLIPTQPATTIPSFVHLESTDVLISKLPARVTEGIDASYLKIKLFELPRYNVQVRKENINLYGLQDGSEDTKSEHDTAQSILQMSNNFNNFDPERQPEKAIEWLQRIEELTNPESAPVGLYIITLSANENFRAKLITLIGLAIMQQLDTPERLRWLLASLKIEFKRDIYTKKQP